MQRCGGVRRPNINPPVSHAGASSTDTAASETLVHDSGFVADFTDDEVDAEASLLIYQEKRVD
jgi:hypothetical protein